MVDIVKGVACIPHSHQAGLILPSRWNVRQKVAVATLCVLCESADLIFCAVLMNLSQALFHTLQLKQINKETVLREIYL